jgi:hypothetical protein
MDLLCKMLFGHLFNTLNIDLYLHLVVNAVSAILLIINYVANEDKDGFTIGSTLNAAGLAFAIGGSLVSLANVIGEGMYSGEEKRSLQNDYFNFLRNLMTSFTLVLVTMQNGQDDKTELRIAMWLMVGQRLIDVGLDLDEPWKLVCDNMKSLQDSLRESAQTESLKTGNNFTMKQILVAACLGALLVFQIIYVGQSNSTLKFNGRDDEMYQFMIILLAGLHLFLILVNMLLSYFAPLKKWYVQIVTGDPDCKDRKIHGLNSIPLITKIVFTGNLFFLSLLAGEHIEDDKNIGLLIYSAISLAVADIVARNII